MAIAFGVCFPKVGCLPDFGLVLGTLASVCLVQVCLGMLAVAPMVLCWSGSVSPFACCAGMLLGQLGLNAGVGDLLSRCGRRRDALIGDCGC
jgi:hypothetical protein